MTKKVLVTNPSGAIRCCGSIRLRSHQSEYYELTIDIINKLKAAGFIVAIVDELEENEKWEDGAFKNIEEENVIKVTKACYGSYAAFNDCNECGDKEDCKLNSINEENFPLCYGIDYNNISWCADGCKYKDKCSAILEDTIELRNSIKQEELPECFGVEYDDYEDCDFCGIGEECRSKVVELEFLEEDPDVDVGVEILLVNKNPDIDSGVKVDITTENPDADPSDNELNWTDENLENINDH